MNLVWRWWRGTFTVPSEAATFLGLVLNVRPQHLCMNDIYLPLMCLPPTQHYSQTTLILLACTDLQKSWARKLIKMNLLHRSELATSSGAEYVVLKQFSWPSTTVIWAATAKKVGGTHKILCWVILPPPTAESVWGGHTNHGMWFPEGYVSLA